MASILNSDRLAQIDNASSVELTQLQALKSALSSNEPIIHSAEKFREILSVQFGIDHSRDLAGFLLFVQSGVSKTQRNADVIISSIEAAMDEWDLEVDFVSRWKERKNLFSEIASMPQLQYLAKKAELQYFNLYHLHSAKVISDLRPVLNADRSNIEDFILFNKLFLIYSDQFESEKTLELTLGLDELEQLRDEILLAISKATVIQKDLQKSKAYEVVAYKRRGN